jgi:hypothetical protein
MIYNRQLILDRFNEETKKCIAYRDSFNPLCNTGEEEFDSIGKKFRDSFKPVNRVDFEEMLDIIEAKGWNASPGDDYIVTLWTEDSPILNIKYSALNSAIEYLKTEGTIIL